jgi:hypothetical protein
VKRDRTPPAANLSVVHLAESTSIASHLHPMVDRTVGAVEIGSAFSTLRIEAGLPALRRLQEELDRLVRDLECSERNAGRQLVAVPDEATP